MAKEGYPFKKSLRSPRSRRLKKRKRFCFYRSFSVALPLVSVIIKRQWLRDRHCKPPSCFRNKAGGVAISVCKEKINRPPKGEVSPEADRERKGRRERIYMLGEMR